MKIEGTTSRGTLVSLRATNKDGSFKDMRCTLTMPTKKVTEWYPVVAGHELIYNPHKNEVMLVFNKERVLHHIVDLTTLYDSVVCRFPVSNQGVVTTFPEAKLDGLTVVGKYNERTCRLMHITNPDDMKTTEEVVRAITVLLSQGAEGGTLPNNIGEAYSLLRARYKVIKWEKGA